MTLYRSEALDMIWRLFRAFLGAALLIGVTLWLVDPEMGHFHLGWAGFVAAAGLIDLGLAAYFARRPLPTDSMEQLALGYRTNFFAAFAFSEAALLIGFVVVFIVDGFWPYLVGLPFFLIGMARIAPTPGNLQRAQQRITAQGSTLSLIDALETTTPARPGRR